MTIVKDIQHLKELCKDHLVDGCILLQHGARSSKSVKFDSESNTFYIYNDIDDTDQELTEQQLFTESNIGEAINKKAFRLY
jgi:hypothetical protein